MEKITYVLGAGFSAVAEVPVMSNFIAKAKDLYYSDKNKYKHFKQIFDRIDELSRIKNYFSADLFNIEELLSIYDMEASLQSKRKAKTFASFIIDVINGYSFTRNDIQHGYPGNWQDFIFGTDENHKKIGSFVSNIFKLKFREGSGVDRTHSFFSERISSDIDYSIVSLNYDTLLEESLHSINAHYNGKWLFEKVKYLDAWENPMLFKLHGDIETGKIIPPTWAKNIDNSMRKTWQNSYDVLRTSTQIRFLGYSLPISDSYFLYFLKAAVKNNPYLKRIDTITLDMNGDVEKRYRNLVTFRDFKFINGDLNDYLSKLYIQENIYARSNTSCDVLEKVHSEFIAKKRS